LLITMTGQLVGNVDIQSLNEKERRVQQPLREGGVLLENVRNLINLLKLDLKIFL